MKRLNRVTCLFALSMLLLSAVSAVSASDIKREKRMAEEVIDVILEGEAVFLKTDNHPFLTIYTESGDSRGVAIILHGRGFHPDWPDTIHPLRVGLAESGWNTLAVQMPVLEKQAKYYDYVPIFAEAVPRIDAAIKYARSMLANDPEAKVVLVAHSCGAHMAMAWAEVTIDASKKIDAYIGLGMGATDYKQPMKKPFPLDRLSVPILDVYADGDYPAVLKMAPERLAMIKQAGNKKSKQVIVTDSDHYYVNKGGQLTRLISQWLKTL